MFPKARFFLSFFCALFLVSCVSLEEEQSATGLRDAVTPVEKVAVQYMRAAYEGDFPIMQSLLDTNSISPEGLESLRASASRVGVESRQSGGIQKVGILLGLNSLMVDENTARVPAGVFLKNGERGSLSLKLKKINAEWKVQLSTARPVQAGEALKQEAVAVSFVRALYQGKVEEIENLLTLPFENRPNLHSVAEKFAEEASKRMGLKNVRIHPKIQTKMLDENAAQMSVQAEFADGTTEVFDRLTVVNENGKWKVWQ